MGSRKSSIPAGLEISRSRAGSSQGRSQQRHCSANTSWRSWVRYRGDHVAACKGGWNVSWICVFFLMYVRTKWLWFESELLASKSWCLILVLTKNKKLQVVFKCMVYRVILQLYHWIVQFKSFHWLNRHRLWAIIPCSTNMVRVRSIGHVFFHYFYFSLLSIFWWRFWWNNNSTHAYWKWHNYSQRYAPRPLFTISYLTHTCGTIVDHLTCGLIFFLTRVH